MARKNVQCCQLPETIDIVAPTDGFILTRNITAGQRFERSTEFYRIADLSEVWIVSDIFGSVAQAVHAGAVACVTLTDQRGTYSVRVSNVLPQVDPQTRVLKLCLEAKNPGNALRPDMFVDVELPVEGPAASQCHEMPSLTQVASSGCLLSAAQECSNLAKCRLVGVPATESKSYTGWQKVSALLSRDLSWWIRRVG
jgi:hypothetical protein